MYPVSPSQPQQGENEHQAVAVHDGHVDALMDGALLGLPGQAVPVLELQPVGEVLGLLASPDELHYGEELLVAVVLVVRGSQNISQSTVPGRFMSVIQCPPPVELCCPVFKDFCETKDITFPDILWKTEVLQYIIQR